MGPTFPKPQLTFQLLWPNGINSGECDLGKATGANNWRLITSFFNMLKILENAGIRYSNFEIPEACSYP